jgi:hypothetical protein
MLDVAKQGIAMGEEFVRFAEFASMTMLMFVVRIAERFI